MSGDAPLSLLCNEKLKSECMNKLLVLLLICVGCSIAFLTKVLAQEQQTGSVRGKIETRAVKPDIASREMRSHSYGMTSMTHSNESGLNEYGNMVVYIENKDLKKERPKSITKAFMDQRNAEFIPHVLPIQRGTIVDFINRDNTYHNVFSLSPTKRFNIGRRPTGENVPIQFDKEGIVQVFCDIHSYMSAYILVLDSPYYVQPDEHGNYLIENIPAGVYTIKVWHERFRIRERAITITPGGHFIENFVME
jgi:plastocyanin